MILFGIFYETKVNYSNLSRLLYLKKSQQFLGDFLTKRAEHSTHALRHLLHPLVALGGCDNLHYPHGMQVRNVWINFQVLPAAHSSETHVREMSPCFPLSYLNFTLFSNTRDEAWESALIIHKILQNKPVFMLHDETFYGKMKSFTLQILHRKKVSWRSRWVNNSQIPSSFCVIVARSDCVRRECGMERMRMNRWNTKTCGIYPSSIFHSKVFCFHGLGLFKLDYTFIFSVIS